MTGASPSTLQRNLAALDRADPELARRLRWSVASDHVVQTPKGVFLQVGASRQPLVFSADELVRRLAQGGPCARVVLLGIGLGEGVDTALQLWSDVPVVAWDRDPWMMRILLSRRDYSQALLGGQLTLVLGSDLLGFVSTEGDRLVRHPLLASVYADELQAWESPEPRQVVLMCTSGLFVGDVARDLRGRGYVPWRIDVSRIDPAEFQRTARIVQPHFGVAINQTVGLPEVFESLGIPLLTWEIDPAVDWLPVPARPVSQSHLFSFRRSVAKQLADAPHGSVTWLPLAAPDHRRPLDLSPEEQARFAAPVSFVGSSLVQRARGYAQKVLQQMGRWLRATGGDPTTAQSRFQAVLAHQRAHPDRWCLPEAMDEHTPGFRDWCRQVGLPSDPVLLLGELPAAEHRLQVVRALAPFGVHVWGDPGWQAVAGGGVQFRGYAGHVNQLTRIYGCSQINIDVGRLYQSDIVTMRVFDVLACGGFLLAAHSDELGDLFELGVEVESWRDRAELVAKVQHFLAHPEQARQIAERGRQAVLDRHRVDQRVDRMLQVAGLVPAQSE